MAPLNDTILRGRAISFANACSLPGVTKEVLTSDWLDQFKKEYNLLSTDDSHSTETAIDISEIPQKDDNKKVCMGSRAEQHCNSAEINTNAMNPPAPVHESGVELNINPRKCPGIDETRHALELIIRYFEMRKRLSNGEHAIMTGMMDRLNNGHAGDSS